MTTLKGDGVLKKIISVLLVVVFILSLVSCDITFEYNDSDVMRVAMVTDSGDINDQSFNEATYKAIKQYCEKRDIDYQYFKPVNDSDADKIQSIQMALDQKYNVLVLPGFAFGYSVEKTVNVFPAKFLAIDVASSNFTEKFSYPENLCTVTYNEEIAGFMAGYAAIKLGYRNLGFLGGAAASSVKRYGYGFVQGIEYAAEELGLDDVSLVYGYGNQYYGDADITAAMETWYSHGTEIVFSCGGGIYTSVCEAACKYKGKVIGVDVDQKELIDGTYGEGMCVTSAIKRIDFTVEVVLDQISDGSFTKEVGGTDQVLGLLSTDLKKNFVGLAYENTQFNDDFTLDDYSELNSKLLNKEIEVERNVDREVSEYVKRVQLKYLGNIK